MTTKKHPTVLLVDSNALVHRAYHALPTTMVTSRGELTNAAYGFVGALFHAIETLRPDTIICCFDVKGDTFRHSDYEQYKAHRKPMDEGLAGQLPRIYELVKALGIPIIEKEGFEADDCIGTLARHYQSEANVLILTGDKDELQLISQNTRVVLLKQGIKESVIVDLRGLKELYGLTPEEFIVFKALRGDPSDNIPGVKGIGEVTALKLVQRYQTLQNLYKAINEAPEQHPLLKGKIRQNLVDEKEMAELSLKLSTIDVHVPLEVTPRLSNGFSPNLVDVQALFDTLEFRSLHTRLLKLTDTSIDARDEQFVLEMLDTKTFLDRLGTAMKNKRCSLAFAYKGVDVRTGSVVALACSLNGKEAFGALWDEAFIPLLRDLYARADFETIIWDVKSTAHLLARFGISLNETYCDVFLADLLLQNREDAHGPRLHKKETEQELVQLIMNDACRVFTLASEHKPALEENGLEKVWQNIEKPLLPVLIRMESKGILVDTKELDSLAKDMQHELDQLQTSIWHEAGEQFNIASPQQLSSILFDKLHLQNSGAKKKATGYSTDAATLEMLRSKHEIIPLLMRYREVAKLKGTYVDALPKVLDNVDNRLHTTYGQIGAATGRLSSNDPNLQNIPARTNSGQHIRACFIAPPKRKLISFDYSQFELRILAHLSDDQVMQESFQQNIDIHLATAAKLHSVALDAVTKQMRRGAKAVNFGILYGLSAHSLSKALDVDYKTAQEFIDRYFALYPKVKQFLQGVIEQATRDGYYSTLFGRRRLFPELQSSVWTVKQAGERMAMNFPMQGTQADLLKMAMVKVARAIAESTVDAQLLLTVHDELVFEVATTDVEKATNVIRPAMESVWQLKVPIIVSGHVGDNWSEMKEIT